MDCKQFCERTKRYKAEIIIFLLFILLWVVAWSGIKPKVLSKEQRIYAHYISHKERALAADAMKSAIIGTLTATSIILAACAAAIGLYKDRDQLPDETKKNFKDAASYGLFSIILAAVNLAYIPAQVNTLNVASKWSINLVACVQLLLMIFSACRLSLAIRKMF